MEKYTLYFNFKNNYGHDKKLPILTLCLKDMDKFTSKYNNYSDLFNNLYDDVKEFLLSETKNGINMYDDEALKKHFSLENKDNKYEIMFSCDLDVIYIKHDEIMNLVLENKMGFSDIEKSILRSKTNTAIKQKYDFFEDVYNKFVKNKRIITMMDTYDVNKKIPTLKDDKLVIASIATDRDNIILLCKKIGQNMIDRRSLASMFKKTYLLLGNNSILSEDVLKSRIEKDDSDISYLVDMAKCFEEYKKSYDKEYELV